MSFLRLDFVIYFNIHKKLDLQKIKTFIVTKRIFKYFKSCYNTKLNIFFVLMENNSSE